MAPCTAAKQFSPVLRSGPGTRSLARRPFHALDRRLRPSGKLLPRYELGGMPLHMSQWLRASVPHQSEPAGRRAQDTRVLAEAEETKQAESTESSGGDPAAKDPLRQRPKRRQADSTDWFSSQLTRRFGLAGGLAWLGVLLFGVVSEQVKTRLEDRSAEEGTKDLVNSKPVSLGDGLQFTDLRQGGGPPVQAGFLTVLHFRGEADGKVFEDTQKRGKPIVLIYGSRPFTAGLCLGVEKGMQGMRAGGIRKITVPPSLGFGERGISLRGTEHVPDKQAESLPPDATLEYTVELIRVSIAPS